MTFNMWAALAGQGGTPSGETFFVDDADLLKNSNGDVIETAADIDGTFSPDDSIYGLNGTVDANGLTLANPFWWNNQFKYFKIEGDASDLPEDEDLEPSLTVKNIVKVDVDLAYTTVEDEEVLTDVDTNVNVLGVKRASVETGNGSDDVTVSVVDLPGESYRTITIDTNGGNDSVTITGATGDDAVHPWYAFDTTGANQTFNTDLGEGDDFYDAWSIVGGQYVFGDFGNDTINSGSGDDTIIAGTADDSIDGAEEPVSEYAGGDDDVVYAGAGNDSVVSGEGFDELYGGYGNDTLKAGSEDDTLEGGAGDDRLFGQEGADIINGDYGYYAEGLVVAKDFEKVEAIELIDAPEETSYNDVIFAGAGNDTVNGNQGDDTITGGSGDDVIRGNEGDDNIAGGTGADVIYGDYSMYDLFFGGFYGGDDMISGGDGNDYVEGGAGNDTINGNNDDDTINGGEGDDNINGGSGLDSLSGDAGNDRIYAAGGNDTVSGGDNNDTLFGAGGADSIVGDAGNDNLYGGTGSDELEGGADNDRLIGDVGNDTLEGGTDNGTFTANLVGSEGNYDLTSFTAATGDFLLGGDNNDTFNFADGDGVDTILDFNIAEDVLNITTGYEIVVDQFFNKTVIAFVDDGSIVEDQAIILRGVLTDADTLGLDGLGIPV